jgi:hypothetical protein
MLGDPGRWPFVGHLRLAHIGDGAALALAARLGGDGQKSDERETLYDDARALDQHLRHALAGAPHQGDRHGLLRAAWDALFNAPDGAFGPHGPESLRLVVVGGDGRGVGVSGLGLGRVWGQTEDGLVALAEAGHPLLGDPGLPPTAPGVLTLEMAVTRVIVCPSHLRLDPIAPEQIDAACGVRP